MNISSWKSLFWSIFLIILIVGCESNKISSGSGISSASRNSFEYWDGLSTFERESLPDYYGGNTLILPVPRIQHFSEAVDILISKLSQENPDLDYYLGIGSAYLGLDRGFLEEADGLVVDFIPQLGPPDFIQWLYGETVLDEVERRDRLGSKQGYFPPSPPGELRMPVAIYRVVFPNSGGRPNIVQLTEDSLPEVWRASSMSELREF